MQHSRDMARILTVLVTALALVGCAADVPQEDTSWQNMPEVADFLEMMPVQHLTAECVEMANSVDFYYTTYAETERICGGEAHGCILYRMSLQLDGIEPHAPHTWIVVAVGPERPDNHPVNQTIAHEWAHLAMKCTGLPGRGTNDDHGTEPFIDFMESLRYL